MEGTVGDLIVVQIVLLAATSGYARGRRVLGYAENRLDIFGGSAFEDQCSGRPELITPVYDPSVEADSYDRGASISLMGGPTLQR
jgi:hypothetical protein